MPVIRLFVACGTQWRAFGCGLDYNAMYRVAESLNIPVDAYVLDGIRALENETLSNKQDAGEPKR